MKLSTEIQNQALMQNVGEVGEFRIQNSSKAFGILSSGLYSNKIRAIVRELSCNAYDSHIAAGRPDVPFDVHLPNPIEPWFSIRDYGVGLDHDQVINIYTTYFESTKTNSNDFVGALGLGSKSPFSYTDNFTVTAIKNGRKGIYTAFVNNNGIPSIVLMLGEETKEHDGVEVKFSVEKDFWKFTEEAVEVYTYFKLRPVVHGVENFRFNEVKYENRDIIPGVHLLKEDYSRSQRAIAVMGNISYPIQVPNAEEVLGRMYNLLRFPLEIHFEIGELDIQASREGLSYIPQTVEAIKSRLTSLVEALSKQVAAEANAISNLWERANYLDSKAYHKFWIEPVVEYLQNNPLPTIGLSTIGYNRGSPEVELFSISSESVAEDYNIQLRLFKRTNKTSGYSLVPTTRCYDEQNRMKIPASTAVKFVIDDTKVGCTSAIKWHWRENTDHHQYSAIYSLSRVDRTKEMDVEGFFKSIHNPPKDNILLASSLSRNLTKVKKKMTVAVYNYKGKWEHTIPVENFDRTQTYYYFPLNKNKVQSKYSESIDLDNFIRDLRESGIPFGSTVYGILKKNMDWAQDQDNWVNIEDYIEKFLSDLVVDDQLAENLALQNFGAVFLKKLNFRSSMLSGISNSQSPYLELANKLSNYESKFKKNHFFNICNKYNLNKFLSLQEKVETLVYEYQKVLAKYPLLEYTTSSLPDKFLVEYINMMDSQGDV